jgi:hypothetical protein
LSEGQFVATYKYALLIAIADLAVQLGKDDGSELELPLRAIAEQFIELYWRHSAPYGPGTQNVLIHGMIVRLAQSEWMHFIQALPSNASLLGATTRIAVGEKSGTPSIADRTAL